MLLNELALRPRPSRDACRCRSTERPGAHTAQHAGPRKGKQSATSTLGKLSSRRRALRLRVSASGSSVRVHSRQRARPSTFRQDSAKQTRRSSRGVRAVRRHSPSERSSTPGGQERLQVQSAVCRSLLSLLSLQSAEVCAALRGGHAAPRSQRYRYVCTCLPKKAPCARYA